MYSLRHSIIARMLLKNVPIRLVAALHDTSVAHDRKALREIHRRTHDDISRAALLQHEPPAGENVIALAG